MNNSYSTVLLPTLFILSSSCAVHTTTPLDAREKAHIVSVNSRSLAEEPGPGWKAVSMESSREQLDRDMKELNAEFVKSRNKTKEILIFVHGGLTDGKNGVAYARERLSQFNENGDIFPIFVTWDSGFASSLGQHLFYENNGINYSLKNWHFQTYIAGPVLAPANLAMDLAGGVVEAPRTTFNALAKASQDYDFAFRSFPENFPSRQRYRDELKKISSKGDEVEFVGFSTKAGPTTPFPITLGMNHDTPISYAIGATHVATIPLKVALSPIYDGLGRPAWNNMKRRATTLVHWSPSFITPKTPAEIGEDDRADGVFCKVLLEVARIKKANPGVKVTLAGHSMGTIVLNEALREINDGNIDLKIDRIIYMAAACSIRDMSQGVGSHLRKSPNCEFYNLCLNPKSEINEYQPLMYLPVCYAGSLLIWIDEMFETPDDFLDRTAGCFENCIIARKHLPQTPKFHLKAFESNLGAKGVVDPQRHGDFSKKRFWEKSFYGPG